MTPFSASPNGVGARRAWLSFGDVGFSGLLVSGSFSGLLGFLAWLWCGCLFFLVLSAWSVFLCFPLSWFRWVWLFRFCWFLLGLVPGSGRKGHPGCMVSARIISCPGPRVLTHVKDRRPADIGSGAGIGSPVWPGPVRKAHERIGPLPSFRPFRMRHTRGAKTSLPRDEAVILCVACGDVLTLARLSGRF